MCAVLVVLAGTVCSPALFGASPVSVTPATMPRLGTVDERFQSFNIEMVEVTGGRFWAPYKKQGTEAPAAPASAKNSAPAGMDPAAFRYREPINLANPRLRKLAAGLAPSYMRVSAAAPATPPAGFNSVLTRPEWKGVVDFSKAVDAKIVYVFRDQSWRA